jgi:hypothetical protein
MSVSNQSNKSKLRVQIRSKYAKELGFYLRAMYNRISAYDFVVLFMNFFHDLLYLIHFEHWDTSFVENESTDTSCLLKHTIGNACTWFHGHQDVHLAYKTCRCNL